jgi:hypothetical protein
MNLCIYIVHISQITKCAKYLKVSIVPLRENKLYLLLNISYLRFPVDKSDVSKIKYSSDL